MMKKLKSLIMKIKPFIPLSLRAGVYRLCHWVRKRILYSSPWAYEQYYRRFTNRQTGAIKNAYDEPTWDGDAPHLLIFTKRYWMVHVALEMAFGKEMQRKGWNVTVVGCDKVISTCDNMMHDTGQPLPITHNCNYCSYLLRKSCQRAGLHYLSMREYMDAHNIEDALLPVERDYGDIVDVSWMRLLRASRAKSPDEFALRDRLMTSARTLDRFFTDYLDNHRVDRVILMNGTFFSERLLSEHCDERNIDYMCYEIGYNIADHDQTLKTLLIEQNRSVVPFHTEDLWMKRKDQPLTPGQTERIRNYLTGRESNTEYARLMTKRETDLSAYGIASDKPLYVMFTNLIWDSAVLGQDTIFESMFEWIGETVTYFRNHPEKQLVIRIHPVEHTLPTHQVSRETVDEYLAQQEPLPGNISVIKSDEKLSSYRLLNRANYCLVYTGTIGMESAYRDLPVIVTANIHYGPAGFTYLPSSQAEYLKLLDRELTSLPDQVTLAERYCHMFFFEKPVPFQDQVDLIGYEPIYIRQPHETDLLSKIGW